MRSIQISSRQLTFSLLIGGVLCVSLYGLMRAYLDESSRFFYQLWLSRGAMSFGLLLVFLWAIRQLPSFFSEEGSARNLAIFRLVFFGFFAVGLCLKPFALLEPALHFVGLPSDARVVPIGMEWLNMIPLTPLLVKGAMLLFAVGAVGAFLGIKTRWSIALFVFGALYLIGIPNLFGKINHNHHIVWFAVILLFSPCADRYSLDAKWSRKTSSDFGREYQQPFLYMWLLMAIIYFFPGFWKIWSCGLDWALTDNVRNQMYWVWFSNPGWAPFFRVDLYPLLYKFIGIYTLIFELLFAVLVLSKRTRWLAFAGGILFHIGTHLFLDIFFVVLVISYVSFINWEKILKARSIQAPKEKVDPNPNSGLHKTAIVLIAVNIIFGFTRIFSFPFSCYPTFDYLVGDRTTTVLYYSGNEQLDKTVLIDTYTGARYRNMEEQLTDAYRRDAIIEKLPLMQALVKKFPNENVSIYVAEISVIPEKMGAVSDSFLLYKKPMVWPE